MTETLTPSRLWKQMTAEQRQRAARAFWGDEDARADQLQAVMLIAQQKKFRPKTVNGLDLDRKTRHLATMPSLPDALGIAHENGLIQEESVKPDAAKIGGAVDAISRQFPAEDVRLYLDTLLCQDPETWAALADITAAK